MSKTCIICGLAAGSGEHVFPAALGGRRTNKNIYCTTHDNGYSSLVNVLAKQLDFFNSIIGVIPDHGTTAKAAVGEDTLTGHEIKLSVNESTLTEPRIFSETPTDRGAQLNIGFPSMEAFERWKIEQEAKGIKVEVVGKATRGTLFLGQANFKRNFGGPYGLAAAGYVAQTFLAQAFPDIARSSALSEFKAYTLEMAQKAQKNEEPEKTASESPVWWDFDSERDNRPNAFEFGHRVTVGVDADRGVVYGRLSFFSTLHFSMIFGAAPGEATSATVTVDIDPLAEHPPKDIHTEKLPIAVATVKKPDLSSQQLAEAISSGKAADLISYLMRRLTGYGLKRTSEQIYKRLSRGGNSSETEREVILSQIIDEQLQRVWNLATYVVENFKPTLTAPGLQSLLPKLDMLIALDANSPNGLSAAATETLDLARTALLAALIQSDKRGELDATKIAQYFGEGPGAAIVGEPILNRLLDSLPT